MAFTITLVVNKKNKNSIARNVTNAICSTVAELKEMTSIIQPTFILDLNKAGMTSGDNVVNANYLVCTKFKRYYWITDIRFVTNHIVEIECVVDALATFATNILNSEAYINYASSNFNPYLPDNRIVPGIATTTGRQEGIFNILDKDGCYVIFVASSSASGKTGVVQGYVLSESNLFGVASEIYSSSLMGKIKDTLYNPDEALVSCLWMPVKQSAIQGDSRPMKFGDYEISSSNFTVVTTTSSIINLVVELPYMDSNRNYDWRNVSPYTDWFIWLPGCGLIPFPMELCLKGTNVKPVLEVGLQLSCTNGDCTYTINCNNRMIMNCKGNIAVQLPVPRTSNGIAGAISAGAGIASGLGMAMVTKNPAFAIGGMLSAASSAASAGASLIQHSISASGSLGGWSCPETLRDSVRLYYSCNELSDNPFGNLKEIIGCPVFKQAKLSEYTGAKVFCSNINFSWDGDIAPTDTEYEMIRQAFVSQEGVILKETE